MSNTFMLIPEWALSLKDQHFVLHAKDYNYPACEANFQDFALGIWINGEPLPGLWNFVPSIFL